MSTVQCHCDWSVGWCVFVSACRLPLPSVVVIGQLTGVCLFKHVGCHSPVPL